ncbi:MAG: hypothetical protein LBG05_08700 [Treponema sp.]|nr:hypothetical protein [Treponema sp.]
MGEYHGFLPQGEDELVDWGENFVPHVVANAASLQIPSDEATGVQTAFNAFKALHLQAISPAKNSIIIAEKNEAKKEFIRLVREMVKFRFANPIITDAVRVQYGLHVNDSTHTSHGVPTTRPDFTLTDKDFRRLNVDFHDQDSNNKARPYGVNGAVISWAVLDQPPANTSALTSSVLATRTPHTMEFAEEERGKTVYVALQWQNTKGQKGPSSEILWAIVP